MDDICTCGHMKDEHGQDPKYPGSTACSIEKCKCIAFEQDEPLSEEPLA